jgi:hypothetical protein
MSSSTLSSSPAPAPIANVSQVKVELPLMTEDSQEAYDNWHWEFINFLDLQRLEKYYRDTAPETIPQETDRQVFGILTRCLKTKNLQDILRSVTSRSSIVVLQTLADIYGKPTNIEVSNLVYSLLSEPIDISSTKTLNEYRARLSHVVRQMDKASVTFPPTVLCAIVLRAINTSAEKDDKTCSFWQTFVMNSLQQGSSNLTTMFRDIDSAITLQQQAKTSGALVLATSNAPTNRPNDKRRTKSAECSHCKARGVKGKHKSENCYYQFPEKAPPGWSPKADGRGLNKGQNPRLKQLAIEHAPAASHVVQAPPVQAETIEMQFNFMAHGSDNNFDLPKNIILYDNGSTRHITNTLDADFVLKHTYRPFSSTATASNLQTGLGSGNALGEVDMVIRTTGTDGIKSHPIVLTLSKCLYMPEFSVSLISESQLLRPLGKSTGITYNSDGDTASLTLPANAANNVPSLTIPLGIASNGLRYF